jgi:SMODS-associated and fused to various effectors sensor domain
VEGAFRLASSFILGFELNERTDVELVMPYAGGDWRSSAEREAASVDVSYREIAQGSDLAVAVGISAPLGDDVEYYLRDSELPVATLLEISPEGGASRESVSGPGHARSIVERVVDICREATAAEVTALHLFLAGPRPLVTMLGRVWNRLPPTYVYADLNPGYGPTYLAES